MELQKNADIKPVPLKALLAICAACVMLAFAPTGMAGERVANLAQPPDVPSNLKGMQKVLQRQQDALQIHNLMNRRSFLHAAGQQDEELLLFANRPDISFGQNQGFRVGIDNITAAYRDRYAKVRAFELERISKLHPEVKNIPENIGVGMFQVHTITTPIIEVAEDGKTAKGMFYTPGAISGVVADGTLGAAWIWEKYAIDFIKENGRWRFWHILVVTDIVLPWGQGAATKMSDASQQGVQGVPNDAAISPRIARTVNKDVYKPLSATTVPRLFPPMPEPYITFSKTFTYGPEVPAQ